MNATIEVPDELYRLVKAKTALVGRAVREVTVELFHRYVEQDEYAKGAGEWRNNGATPGTLSRLLPHEGNHRSPR